MLFDKSNTVQILLVGPLLLIGLMFCLIGQDWGAITVQLEERYRTSTQQGNRSKQHCRRGRMCKQTLGKRALAMGKSL